MDAGDRAFHRIGLGLYDPLYGSRLPLRKSELDGDAAVHGVCSMTRTPGKIGSGHRRSLRITDSHTHAEAIDARSAVQSSR